MKKIVYIMSDNRSGSTLLDQLLGAHQSVMSLGEVHQLRAYALQDRSLYNPVHPLVCSCGMAINHCEFWSQVEQQLGRAFETLTLKPRLFGLSDSAVTVLQRVRRRVGSFVRRNPQVLLSSQFARLLNGPRVADDSFALFDAIFSQTSATYLVDSSKSPFRFRMLYDYCPDRMYAILLGRDYRGTVHSSVRRGQDAEASARSWAMRMRQMKQLTYDIPKNQLIRVRYEDLCVDARAELSRICQFLGLEMSDDMLSRPSDNVHHIGGSPSKFDPSRKKIVLDQSYLDAFTTEQLAIMKDIVGETATDWGYK